MLVARARGRVALDTSGPALREAMRRGPDLVKPNRDELEELGRRQLADREALVEAAEELADRGVGTVVVSMGGDGAVFARDGDAAFATPPPVRVASTVGAGDAMVAGTIAGTLRGSTSPRVAALATAFSSGRDRADRPAPGRVRGGCRRRSARHACRRLDRRRTP